MSVFAWVQAVSARPIGLLPPQAVQFLKSPSGLCLLALFVLLLCLRDDGGKKKGILARGRLGGKAEIRNARRLACRQLAAGKLDEFALFVGTPRHARVVCDRGRPILDLPPDPQTFYVPSAHQNVLVVGGTGWGKSYSFIDPCLRSAALLGKTLFIFDFKGHEDVASDAEEAPKLAPSSKQAGYLRSQGYRLWYVAPGFAESHGLNPLDLLAGPEDGEGAFQLADVLQSNFSRSSVGAGSSNEFFRQTGNLLVRAIFMLAKTTRYPDIAMCHKLLNALTGENVRERLQQAESEMPGFVRIAFDQFLASTSSPETAGSIAATASVMFQLFMSPTLMRTFARTTMPLDFDGRHAVIFKMNARYRATYGPLLAACIQLLIERNIYRARKTQLLFFGDEINGIKLPNLAHWLNQNRSAGFGAVLGTQSIGFLKSVYGNDTDGIRGGCGTHVVFHLNDEGTAKTYSDRTGEEDVRHKNKSRNSSSKSGTSRGHADHLQKRPVVEATQLQKLPRGKALIFGAGFGDRRAAGVPVFHKFVIPKHDRAAVAKSAAEWPQVRDEAIAQQERREFTDADLAERGRVATQLILAPNEAEAILNG